MRKIDKKCLLSTAYKAWEESIETSGQNHPKYNSSKGKYYLDIIMNLFHCQKGLCAYTEMHLCSPKYYIKDNWKKSTGKYLNRDHPNKPKARGQLEHFDRNKKENQAWLWDNLFMADSDVNTKIKSKNKVDSILKPDSANYDEFTLLEYDYSKHIFIPNTSLGKAKQVKIKKMIDTLGINFDPVIDLRRMHLDPIIQLIDFGAKTWTNIKIEQFPTAFEMIKREILNLPVRPS
jgi:hypothetical protein